MAIVSYSYLFLFLPSAILLCRATASRAALRTPALVLTGVAYYALAAGLYQLALLIGMSLMTFAGVRASVAGTDGARRNLDLVVVMLALATLATFKLMPVGSQFGGVALPLGISFYTFNLVSYGLDVRRGRTAPSSSFLPVAAYSTFFPSVSAGPLLRYGDFHPQESGRRLVDADLLEFGVRTLILGLAKKVLVADPLGVAIEPLFANYERLSKLPSASRFHATTIPTTTATAMMPIIRLGRGYRRRGHPGFPAAG